MFGISLYEFIVIVVIAVIFIKPQDVPNIMFNIGKYVRKIKNIFFNIKGEAEQIHNLGNLEDYFITEKSNNKEKELIQDKSVLIHNQQETSNTDTLK